ncbi:MAG: lysophospholipid acyltransferase family protein [Verrucomicrobia bacterium]|nr:lysophospholipid acyltransferase family protein [Verrucomicrobiota bacterium]
MALREKLEYAATIATLNFSRILPEEAVYALFKGFALLFYIASGRRRNLALRNTEIAFPEMPIKERRVLVKKSYVNLSESMVLNILIMTNRVSNERLMDMVETDGWERFDRTHTDNSKGLLAITGHLGNWELMPQYAALRLGRQVHVIARKGNNLLLEERIVRPLRERFGVSVFYKKNALMRIMKAIKKGDLCGLLIDQKLKPPEGIYVDFFGKPAPTTGSPALLQIRFGVTVQPAFMIKAGHRKYRLLIGEPVHWTDNGKPMEEQVHELTRIHQQIIEEMVRQYPDQWFWMHNRWGLKKEER